MSVLSSNGRPGTRQGSRTPHRGAALPVDAYSLAVSCGGRGVSLSTTGPPAFRHPPYRALSASPDTTGTAPRPARHVAPRPGSRHAGSCPVGAGSLPRLGGPPGRRGTPPSARYRECSVRCLAMRRRPPMLLRCSGHWRSSRAAFTRRALRPGNVACGDRCVRDTIPPRHHAGINDLLSKALGATGPKADFGLRHYRIPPPGNIPRKTTSAASGRRSGSDGSRLSTWPDQLL